MEGEREGGERESESEKDAHRRTERECTFFHSLTN